MVANFSAHGTVGFFEELSVLATVARNNKEVTAQLGAEAASKSAKHQEALEDATKGVERVLETGKDALQLFNNGHIKHALDQLKAWTQGDRRWDDLFTRVVALREAVRIELDGHLFYSYPTHKGQKFKELVNDWKPIFKAFPEVGADCFAATDCYCLGYDTASVFHSMRVAEIGLRALAKERRITLAKSKPIDWACWQEIIGALEKEIRSIGQNMKAGAKKDAALDFYSGARADLNAFKDEYRNLVMHVRKQYDEFQALRALTRVHEFMGRLAEKMDHKHQRIRWGRSS